MISPALKLILSFKITCILRSSQTGTDARRKEDGAYSRLIFHFDLYYSVYQKLTEYNWIIIILLMQWMMLLLVYYFTLLLILNMTSSAPERFRRSWFWGVTDWYQSFVYSELSISTHKRYTNYKYIGIKTLYLRFYTLNSKIFK